MPRIRTRRHSVVAGAVIAATALIVAGCSSSPGASDGDVEIRYAIWDQAQKATVEKVVAEFEEANPNITVKVEVSPWDSYFTKLRTAVTSGTAPDVFWLGKTDFPTYADGGALLPIDDLVAESDFDTSVFSETAVDGATWDGTLLGLPKDVDSFALWYNKTLFAEAGIEPPSEGWTQQDLIDAAIALTDKDAGQYGMVSSAPGDQIWFNTILQEGGHVISDDGKSSGVNTPEGIQGIQFWVDLIQKYGVSPDLQQMTDTDPTALFQSGKVAMMYFGSWGVNEMKTNPYVVENISIAPMAEIKVPGGTAGGITNVIAKSSKHADAAWLFLQYLGGENAAKYQAEAGIIPAYESAQSIWADSAPESLNARVFLDALKVATPLPSSVDVAIWRDFAIEELTQAWQGNVDVPTAAARIAEVMDDVLSSAGGE